MQKVVGTSEGITKSVPGSHREIHKGRGGIKLYFEDRIDFCQEETRGKNVLGRENSRSEVIIIILQYSKITMEIR